MPIAKKKDKDIPQDFLNQMKANLKKAPEPVVEEVTEKLVITSPDREVYSEEPVQVPVTTKATTVPERKEKYADVMNIRLSKGRRNEIKAFCTNCGVTVTQYIESSFEFFAREVAAGNIVISKGGISKVEK
jgi:hypothetical protein